MHDEDFALLLRAKQTLEEAENRLPLSSRVKAIHALGFRLICHFREQLGLTQEQFDEIATPQGGGTPKTPPQ